MALYSDVLGGVHSTCTGFPLNKTSTASNNSKLVGKVVELKSGLKAMLVQASAAVTSAGLKVFKYSDTDAFKVAVAAANTDLCIGVAHPDLGDLATDDYFWLLLVPKGRQVTLYVDASGCTAGRTLNPSNTTDGYVEDSGGTTITANVTIGIALETVAAAGEVRALVAQDLLGANA